MLAALRFLHVYPLEERKAASARLTEFLRIPIRATADLPAQARGRARFARSPSADQQLLESGLAFGGGVRRVLAALTCQHLVRLSRTRHLLCLLYGRAIIS